MIINMNKFMKYVFLLIVGFVVTSCQHCIVNDEQKLLLKVNLEPDSISIYDLFDSIQIIPLETTDSCLLTGPVKLLTTAQANYILDWNNFKIFIFDNEGRFSHSVGKTGQGPGEYTQVYDVVVDESRNLVRMLSPFGRIYNYKLNSGQFIDDIQLPAKSNFQKMQEIENNSIMTWSLPSDSEDFCITIIDANTGETKTSLWKGPRMLNASIVSVFYTFDSRTYFTPAFDNNKVYEVIGDSLKLAFQWDFGKDNLDMSEYGFTYTDENRVDEGREFDKYLKEGRIPYRLCDQYENAKYRFISLDYNFFKYQKYCFYRKKDAKSFFFDRTVEGIKIKFPMDFTDDYVAFITPGEELESYKYVLSADKYEKLMSRSEDDNPCLVKLYFK